MRALEAMGVIAPRHGSGTYVTDLTGGLLARPLVFVLDVNRGALGDIFSVRVMLEAGAAEAAAMRMTAERLAQLELHVAEMRGATDADTLLVPDLAFHRLVHEASGNEVLLALMDGLRALTRESLLISAGLPDARQLAADEHAAIVAALRERDPVGAAVAMRRHVEGAHHRAAAARQAPVDDGGAGQGTGGPV
jgi:GntR family transcriptional repressor for pyruvate dehydrogenase complex